MPDRGSWGAALSINGSANIPAGYHNGSGKITQNIPTLAGSTITPSLSSQTISSSGKYLTGNITIGPIPNNRKIVDPSIGGLSSSYPSVSMHIGMYPQIQTTTVSNQRLFAICPQIGYYGGGGTSYTGVPIAEVAAVAGITADKLISTANILGIQGTGKIHKYARGTVVSSSGKEIDVLYSVRINIGFTPIVGFVLAYISGDRDITVYAPDNSSPKPWHVLNFNQPKRFGFNSWGDNNGMYGIVIGPNMVLPVSYGSTTYSYWFAGY